MLGRGIRLRADAGWKPKSDGWEEPSLRARDGRYSGGGVLRLVVVTVGRRGGCGGHDDLLNLANAVALCGQLLEVVRVDDLGVTPNARAGPAWVPPRTTARLTCCALAGVGSDQ